MNESTVNTLTNSKHNTTKTTKRTMVQTIQTEEQTAYDFMIECEKAWPTTEEFESSSTCVDARGRWCILNGVLGQMGIRSLRVVQIEEQYAY